MRRQAVTGQAGAGAGGGTGAQADGAQQTHVWKTPSD